MLTAQDDGIEVKRRAHRFFAAARNAIEQWNQSDDAMVGGVATLRGSMMWAASPFEAQDKHQERSMAYSGAVVSALADRFVQGNSGDARHHALCALGAVETQLIEAHDTLIDLVHRRLQQRGLLEASPGCINEAVWLLLFPHCPHGGSHADLVEVLARRLPS